MRTSTLLKTGLATLAAALLGLAALPSAADAASATADLTIGATVSARATLTLGAASIDFADADPDTVPSIPSTPASVAVTAKVRTGNGNQPTLTVVADGPLTDGGSGATIPISAVTWTASAAPFIAGTMNDATAQSAATFGNGSTQATGSFSYFLANNWSYNVGTYTATATYTLSAP